MRRLAVDGSDYTLLQQGFRKAVAIDFDIAEERIYVIDYDVTTHTKYYVVVPLFTGTGICTCYFQTHKIHRMFLNGTGLEVVVWQGIPGAEGLAIDWIPR